MSKKKEMKKERRENHGYDTETSTLLQYVACR